MLNYSARRNAFEKKEWSWRIEDDALVATDHLGREDFGPWREVIGIRLAYAPTQYKTWRHVVVLRFSNGVKWTIDNSHFAGVGDFEDRTTTYAPLVREIVARVKAGSPGASARVGAGPVGYWITILVLGLLFAGLAGLLLELPVVEFPGAVWVKLAIIAFFLPTLILWARKARPRAIALGDIPEDALPKSG